MRSQTKRPLVFALCGVDGVGKTSLFNMMSERLGGSDFRFIGRGPAEAERLVERRFPRRFNDWRDWLEGEHSEALAVACAIDYGIFYDRVIRPLSEPHASAPREDSPRAIITDRHAICFLAYAHCNPSPNRLAVTLLNTFPPPDVIFFVTLPEPLVEARMGTDATRALDEFENVNAQRRQMAAYESLLPHYPSRVVYIDNSDALDATCERVMAEILNFLDGERADAV